MYQEEYKKISNRLAVIADLAIETFEIADKKKQEATLTYIGDMLTSQLNSIQQNFSSDILTLRNRAEKELNNVLEVIEIKLNNDFFNDITANQFSELEMIKSLDLRLEEVERYADKFKDNGAMLKVFENIIFNKGFYIVGKSFYRENEFLNQVKSLANQVINRLEQHFSPISITIAKNMLVGKVEERQEENEVKVYQK